jgi:hypothetical protein
MEENGNEETSRGICHVVCGIGACLFTEETG